MEIKQILEKKLEKEYSILMKQDEPSSSISNMLEYIDNHEIEPKYKMIHAYNYGHIQGIRSERDMNKWNTIACYYNMHAYVTAHDGQLPNSYDELMKWVRSMARQAKEALV